jgi:hypothetical protein
MDSKTEKEILYKNSINLALLVHRLEYRNELLRVDRNKRVNSFSVCETT